MARNMSNHSESPVKGRGSPRRKSPSRRERSPARQRSFNRDGSPAREKRRSDKSLKLERSVSPKPRSPSPRTKRLRRGQAEREAEKVPEREQERSRGRGKERGLEREGGSEKEMVSDRRERRSGRDDVDGKSSSSRQDRSASPSDRHHKSRRRSHSPQPALDGKAREGVKTTEREYERNHSRGSDRDAQRERGSDREKESTRIERRSGRDDPDQRSSRSKHGRSISPSDRHRRNKHRSRSPADARARDEVSGDIHSVPTSRGADDGNDENDAIARMKAAEAALEAKKKEQPSFELSGKLAAETNRVRGVTLLFNEPPDARKPDIRWRLYVFKNGESPYTYTVKAVTFLGGKEGWQMYRQTTHPAASNMPSYSFGNLLQVEIEKPDGMLGKQTRPYLMDLGSTNKTFLNDVAVEPQRYYELREKDTIKFGNTESTCYCMRTPPNDGAFCAGRVFFDVRNVAVTPWWFLFFTQSFRICQ
ncbi:hypothetical protein TIFTF001_020682 [Ficus carica]|uniref:FHA domain-containing protein n=1 Tax=Ficus carica TaxID=3494 RepID=A0AA88AUA2_FICCA|nr:hypothetical protein TIFTF001_020682 [Ficus carica]